MRRRILLVIGGTFLVMLAIITLATGTLLRESYAKLERHYVERDVLRVGSEFQGMLDGLGATTKDYASWTDMYRFVEHPTTEFSEENFSDAASKNLHVNVRLVLDLRGKIVFQRTSGVEPGRSDVGEELVRWIEAHPDFAGLRTRTDASQGFVVVAGGILLAAARPILDSEETLPVAGTFVMARVLDGATIDAISREHAISIGLLSVVDPALSPAAAVAVSRISETAPIALDASSASIVTAWTILPDAAGSPAVLLSVGAARDIWMQGVRTIRYFFLWLLFIGAGFAAAVMLTVQKIILSRLGRLSAVVLAIGTGGTTARRISISGRDQIAYLGAAINGMLDALERSTAELRSSERRIEAFLDAVPDVIFRVTRDGTITDARSPARLPLLEAANDLVGRDAEQILSLYSFLSPEHFNRSIEATEAALDTGVPQTLEFHVDVEGGRRYYQERFVAAGKDEAIVLVREVTALKKAEEARRQEVLLKEIHHRVKNNLQVISSLLSLQARAAGDPRTAALLEESRDRVRSMALIHEKLYQTDNQRGVSFAAYARDLAAHLRHSYAGNSESVQVCMDVEEITLDLDLSVPCGLIITELLSNALKHAFPGGRRGTVTVGLRRDGPGELVLSVSDDGVGMPAGVDAGNAATLGLRIVMMLVEQIKGTLCQRPGPGASFSVSFPVGSLPNE